MEKKEDWGTQNVWQPRTIPEAVNVSRDHEISSITKKKLKNNPLKHTKNSTIGIMQNRHVLFSRTSREWNDFKTYTRLLVYLKSLFSSFQRQRENRQRKNERTRDNGNRIYV